MQQQNNNETTDRFWELKGILTLHLDDNAIEDELENIVNTNSDALISETIKNTSLKDNMQIVEGWLQQKGITEIKTINYTTKLLIYKILFVDNIDNSVQLTSEKMMLRDKLVGDLNAVYAEISEDKDTNKFNPLKKMVEIATALDNDNKLIRPFAGIIALTITNEIMMQDPDAYPDPIVGFITSSLFLYYSFYYFIAATSAFILELYKQGQIKTEQSQVRILESLKYLDKPPQQSDAAERAIPTNEEGITSQQEQINGQIEYHPAVFDRQQIAVNLDNALIGDAAIGKKTPSTSSSSLG